MRLFGGSTRRLVRSTLERDPYVQQGQPIAASLGLRPVALPSVASHWRLPPLVQFNRLVTNNVVWSSAGQWRDRQVIAAVAYQVMSTFGDAVAGGLPRRGLCYLEIVAARISEPAESLAWVAAAPEGASLNYGASTAGGDVGMWATLPRLRGFFPRAAGYPVAAPVDPRSWQVRAHNTRFAAMLMTQAPELLAVTPAVWHIDDFDLVHITPKPAGTPPPTRESVARGLDVVAHGATVVEQLIRDGYGDRPFTPTWPPGQQTAQRFPDDVAAALRRAGWTPGRADPRYLPPGLQAFPPAAASVTEFGGLTISHDSPGPGYPAGTYTLTPFSRPGLLDKLSHRTGKSLFPLGQVDNEVYGGSLLLAVDQANRVFGLRRDDDLLLGYTFDEALIKLTRGLFTVRISNGGSLS